MDRTDSDYAAFLDRLPELRRHYDPRLHQFEVTRLGRGDSLGNVARYFEQVGSVREANRQTLRRLVAFVNHMRGGMSREDAVKQAWRDFPDPRHGIPRYLGAPQTERPQAAGLRSHRREPHRVRRGDDDGPLPSLEDSGERVEPVHMDRPPWCHLGKSRWVRKGGPYTHHGTEVTCAECLEILAGATDPKAVHFADRPLIGDLVPLCGLNRTRILTRRSAQVTCPRCAALKAAANRDAAIGCLISLLILAALAGFVMMVSRT